MTGQVEFHIDPAAQRICWGGAPPSKLVRAAMERGLPLVVERERFSLPFDQASWQIAVASGLPAALPELVDYDWPGTTKPFRSQQITASVFLGYARAFSLSEMGTGKTRAALYALDALRIQRAKQGLSTRALIVAPLSTLVPVWKTEINETFFGRLIPVILHGTRRQRVERLVSSKWNTAIINHAGVATIWYELHTAKFDVIIVDDASAARNSSTLIWKALNTIANGAKPRRWTTSWKPHVVPYVWALTGTPTPNAPTDAWALKALVRPAEAGRFSELQDSTMRLADNAVRRTYVPRPDAPQKIRKYLVPAVRFTRSEVYELPPEMTVVRTAQVSKEQRHVIDELRKEARARLKEGTVTAVNAGVFLAKVLQVLGGTVLDDHGKAHPVDCADRLSLVTDLIEEANAKVLVFAAFRGHIGVVADAVRKVCTVEQIHGGVSFEDRNRIFDAFQTSPDPHVIVAHPKTMAHGLTLTAADTVIWYGPTFSSEQYQQANARIARPSQTNNRLIVHIQSDTIERQTYSLLSKKLYLQDKILSLYENFALGAKDD